MAGRRRRRRKARAPFRKRNVVILAPALLCLFALFFILWTVRGRSGGQDKGQRILFIGDSRTVDLFSATDERVEGRTEGNVTVYAENGRQYTLLSEVLGKMDSEDYDTLVSWMGANDRGRFENYVPIYEKVLKEGKGLILCTVGPTQDNALDEEDAPDYGNAKMVTFNENLLSWAGAHDVRVIDLYSYIVNTEVIQIDPADGIHYLPQPTIALWEYILGQL